MRSEAILMRKFWSNRDIKQTLEKGWRAEEGMKDFLESVKCRRVILDKEMDGRVDRRGCEMGEERCDICRGAPRGEKRRRIVSHEMGRGGRTREDVDDESRVQSRFDSDETGSGFGNYKTGLGFEDYEPGSGFGVFDSASATKGQR